MPPFGIDVCQDSLAGLILAEVEFDSALQADSLILPSLTTFDSQEAGWRTPHGRMSGHGWKSTDSRRSLNLHTKNIDQRPNWPMLPCISAPLLTK